jgi:hypothetical protein
MMLVQQGAQPTQWIDAGTQGVNGGLVAAGSRTQYTPSILTDSQARGLHASSGNLFFFPTTCTMSPTANTHNCNIVYNFSREEWVLNSGATDHMAYSQTDLININHPLKNGIFNANAICYPVSSSRDVVLSPTLTLHNALVVSSLSTKLISVGQLTKVLNCVMLMFPNHCIFQDIQTKKILDRGTRRGGLYYLDSEKIRNSLISVDSMKVEKRI